MVGAAPFDLPGQTAFTAVRPIDQSSFRNGDPHNLDRFVRAQAGCYRLALEEMRGGQKRGHWIWFIFPQILGLGKSSNARLYAIQGAEEALAYCEHELLGGRLVECTQAMVDHAGRKSALALLGPIDALKFHSSMTLFDSCCPSNSIYTRALDAFYSGKRDAATLEAL